MKKIFFFCVLTALLLSLSGCRSRTTLAPRGADKSAVSETTDDIFSGDAQPENVGETVGETVDDPLADRAEYDETARAELLDNQTRSVHGDGEGGGLPHSQNRAEDSVMQLSGDAALTATRTLPAEEAERLGVSESAPVAETAQRYYDALLQSRVQTLFECKKLNVYIETPNAFVTVHKTSDEHALVLAAGGYDVAAKRAENDLTVDGGWVQRKNPDFIVKWVDASVLGENALGTEAAQSVCKNLLARKGVHELTAARDKWILLLSASLLDTPQLQTAAAAWPRPCIPICLPMWTRRKPSVSLQMNRASPPAACGFTRHNL